MLGWGAGGQTQARSPDGNGGGSFGEADLRFGPHPAPRSYVNPGIYDAGLRARRPSTHGHGFVAVDHPDRLFANAARGRILRVDMYGMFGGLRGFAVALKPVERIGFERPGAHVRRIHLQDVLNSLESLIETTHTTQPAHIVLPGKQALGRKFGER